MDRNEHRPGPHGPGGGPPPNLADMMMGLFMAMSGEGFDPQAFRESAHYRDIQALQGCMHTNRDEDGEGAIAYWAERGLKKELHDTESNATKWASYLPLSIESHPERTYPLLFVLHGSNNPIYLAESYGYTHIAAEEELIVIIPENETPESIDRLFAYAHEHYPVDWSRVYMVGYSLGGFMTARHGIRWPERFAGVGMGGMLFANGLAEGHWQGDVFWPGESITPDMVAHAAKVGLPMCTCMGEYEILGLVPVTKDEPRPPEELSMRENEHKDQGRIDLSSQNKIASINNWRQIGGCGQIPEKQVREAAQHTMDIVTEKIGFPFERTEVRNLEGCSHYIGDCVNPDGETFSRFVCIGNAPHWPTKTLTRLTWEFLRQFSRDPETGRIQHL